MYLDDSARRAVRFTLQMIVHLLWNTEHLHTSNEPLRDELSEGLLLKIVVPQEGRGGDWVDVGGGGPCWGGAVRGRGR